MSKEMSSVEDIAADISTPLSGA